MRIRRKKWAQKELEESKFYIDKPDEFRGKWGEKFINKQPLHIELGCGKGIFSATLASNHRENNYIAVDMIEAMLGLSKRNIEQAYEYKDPENLYLIRANVEKISEVFDIKDNVERIYINFCNPWPKKKHAKRRLTSHTFLPIYQRILKNEGQLILKTDNRSLFEFSLISFQQFHMNFHDICLDLHNSDGYEDNIQTEYERKFSPYGPIYRIVTTFEGE